MGGTAPTRIDDDVASAAKAVAAMLSRSAAQQVNHWARIGRELEASPSINGRDIAAVLAGNASYDDLTVREQAVVRAEWHERTTSLRQGLDLQAEFLAEGSDWVEADDDGNVVLRSAAGRPPARARRPRAG